MKYTYILLFLILCSTNYLVAQTCATPMALTIGATQTGNTSTVGDLFSGSCMGNYDDYDDYIFSYTAGPMDDGQILQIGMTPDITYSGLAITTETCGDGMTCVVQEGNSTMDPRNLEATMTDGVTYYIVISRWGSFTFPSVGFSLESSVVAPPGCLDVNGVTPICTDQAVSFDAEINQISAEVANPSVGYGCLGAAPNPAWYYLEIATTGTLAFDISNSNNLDVDWAAWGPFTDLAGINTTCGNGAAPFDTPIDCSFSTITSGTIDLGSVVAGNVYAVLVTNFSNMPTAISMATTGGSTATTNCSIIVAVECAATCADAATNSCNVFETPGDTPAASYAEIAAGGGESCFPTPLDVSGLAAGDQSAAVTQCWEYTHNTAGSSEFYVLSGTSTNEANNVNGVNDCEDNLLSIEIFDAACANLVTAAQGATYSSAVMGASYTVCITGYANNGTAEGDCTFDCMAHSVTPTLDVVQQCTPDAGTISAP